jgi:hypothetical protein
VQQTTGLRLVSWNLNQNRERNGVTPWDYLWTLARDEQLVAALVQEAPRPPRLPSGACTWPSHAAEGEWQIPIPPDRDRPWSSAVVVFDEHRTQLEPIDARPLAEAGSGAVAASHPGQFSAARLTIGDERLTIVSLYGLWEEFSHDIYAVRSLHRAVADLAPLFVRSDPIVVAGDLNIWRGVGQWRRWYQTVFDLFEAYELHCVGPGSATKRIPTYDTGKSLKQTDFAFAKRLDATATVGDWGPSDHRPVLINVRGGH